jgi:hypothetical protein
MAISGAALGISILFNTIIAGISATIFEIFMHIPYLQKFYKPRQFTPNSKLEHQEQVTTYFRWFTKSISNPSKRLLETSGIDAVVYSEFLNYKIIIFVFLLIYCIGVVLPVNYSGDYVAVLNQSNASYSDLDTTYMTNISPGSSKLWVHFASVYFISLVLMTIIWKASSSVIKLRQQHPYSNRTVLVTDIPATHLYEITKQFRDIFGVESIKSFQHIYVQDRQIQKYYKEYLALQEQIDNLSVVGSETKTLKLEPKKYKEWGVETFGSEPIVVDRLEFCNKRLQYITKQIVSHPKSLERSILLHTKDTQTQEIISHSVVGLNSLSLRVCKAPAPKEIIHSNIGKSKKQRILKTGLMLGIYVIILLFYIPLCAAIQALINYDQLKSYPGISTIVQLPFVSNLLQAILPSLVITIFLAIIPLIINMLCVASGMFDKKSVDFGLMSRLYIFQFFAVFLASVIGGTALDQITTIIDDPSQIYNILGSSLPSTATFFMTYILLGVGGGMLGFLRIVGLILYNMNYTRAKTVERKRQTWDERVSDLGASYVNNAIIMMLGIIFCCQAPIITAVTFYYFIWTLMQEKFRMIYVFDRSYESYGEVWKLVFPFYMTGIYIFQVMMILQLALKSFPYVVALIPVVIITVVFNILHVKYLNPYLSRMPLTCFQDNHEEDILDYTPPVFKIRIEEML